MLRGPVSCVVFQVGVDEHSLGEHQLERLNDWLSDVAAKCDEKHRAAGLGFMVDQFKARGEVYAGVTGGNLTFSVTPTSLGTVFKVSDAVTGETLDLSEYENW